MDTYSIRLYAVDKAIDIVKSAPHTSAILQRFKVASILEDAEAIEKYILRDKAEPKQE